MTRRLVDHITREAGRRTFAEIAADIGISVSAARRVFIVQMVNRMKIREFEMPRVLGIDEKYLFGTYFVVIGDIEKRTYLDIIGTRDVGVMREYFESRHDRDRVRFITSDMESRYHKIAAELFPDAAVIIDKYHVLEMANGVVDRLRFSIAKEKQRVDKSWYRRNRKLLLKRRFDIKKGSGEEKVLDRMFKDHPELKLAYDTKEEMFNIYNATDRKDAEKRYVHWRKNMPISMTKRFGGILKKIREHSDQIYNYFDHSHTNAYMEGLNRCIGDLHREGRGYDIDTLRAKLLVAHGGIFEEQPKFERVHVKPVTDFEWRDLFEAFYACRQLSAKRFAYFGLQRLRTTSTTPGLFSRGRRKFMDMDH